jgi:phosphonate transport system substrate-binding protein
MEEGVFPGRDAWIILGGKQDELLMKLLLEHKVDAALVREAALKAVKASADLEQIRIIGTTDFYPNWCLAAFPETDPTVVGKVQEAVLKLTPENPEHASILELIGAGKFVLVDSDQYQQVLDLVAALGVPL